MSSDRPQSQSRRVLRIGGLVALVVAGVVVVTGVATRASSNQKLEKWTLEQALPSVSVIAETGRSSGKVTCRKRCQAFAPSRAAASYSTCGMSCRPLWSSTRLKGMPTQMLATVTETRAQVGEVSQSTGPTPTRCRA